MDTQKTKFSGNILSDVEQKTKERVYGKGYNALAKEVVADEGRIKEAVKSMERLRLKGGKWEGSKLVRKWRDLKRLPFFGMWKDRDDLRNSVDFVNRLRNEREGRF